MLENDLMQDLDAIEVEGGASLIRPQGILPSIDTNRDSSTNRQKQGMLTTEGSKDKKSNSQASFMDEVDELLLEQELLSPTSAQQTMNKISSKGNLSPLGAKRRPLKESLRDSTLEKLMNGQAIDDLDSPVKGQSKSQEQKKLELKQKISDDLKKPVVDFPDDDFNLDNQDDLNMFINKYEGLLLSKKQEEQEDIRNKTATNDSHYKTENNSGLRQSDMNEIDSLVEEELSRNSNDFSELQTTTPPLVSGNYASVGPGTPGSKDFGRPHNILTQGDLTGQRRTSQGSVQNQIRGLTGTNGDGAEKEPQTLKELFAATNYQRENGGPALPEFAGSVNENEEKGMKKNRSKNQLKNKFSSSAAPYQEQSESEPSISSHILQHIQDENDKENLAKKTKTYKLTGDTDIMKKKSASTVQYSDLIEDDADVDEIIKSHMMEEEQKQNIASKNKKKKQTNKKDIKEPVTEVGVNKEKILVEMNTDLAIEKKDDEGDDSEGDGTDEEEDTYAEANDQFEEAQKLPENLEQDDEDDGYDYMDDSLDLREKSPKKTLIDHLRLMSDIFNSSIDGASDYYDQLFDERAQFMLDYENILKIMTFDETVEYILPCMQIYSSEQDYLKLKLFQNLDKLFKKLFKAEVFIPKPEIIDIITINIFPLASRMLMLSDEAVQNEGVEALLSLCKQYIPLEQSQNLMIKVIQVIMDRISASSEHQENEDVIEKAKIAVLVIMNKFAEQDIFKLEQCSLFLQKHLAEIQDGMLFKIKKFLLPALISISKHLEYPVFLESVYKTFLEFSKDEIWGVRKVCVENMSDLIKYLKYDETEKLNYCFEFFQKSMSDSNRWVKNQALIQFGPIVHQIYLKTQSLDKNQETMKLRLQDLINQFCMSYYDSKLVLPGADQELDDSLVLKIEEYSFMQNQNDDVDKIKYYWAYNMPCAILVNGGQKFWLNHLKSIYDLLYQDILINVRTAMSSGFIEVINHLDIDKMEKEEDQQYFVTVLNHYLKDTDEKISQKVLPAICPLVSKFGDNKKTELLDSLIKTKIENIKEMKNVRDGLITMLEQLFQMFSASQLLEANFHDYLFDIMQNERAINYKVRAAKVVGSKIIAPLIKGKKYRTLLTTFTDTLRTSKNFRDRQLYINIAESTYLSDKEIFKKHFAKNVAADLENESCFCVKISLARLCNTVAEGYSKSLDKVRFKLIADNDPNIIQHMPSSKEGKEQHHKKRYLKIGYGDDLNEKEQEQEITEESWLLKEQKEIEEVEKTVTIRFANYSTLMRAQTLTQGLSAQLAMLYLTGGMPPNIGQDQRSNEQSEFTRRLLEKAGLSADIESTDETIPNDFDSKQEEIKTNIKPSPPRSLSPLLDEILLPDKEEQKNNEISQSQDSTKDDIKQIQV